MHRLEARGHILRDAWRADMSDAHAHNSVLGDYPPPQTASYSTALTAWYEWSPEMGLQ